MIDLEPLPGAWMGYCLSVDKSHVFAIRVCAWHSDKDKAEALAKAQGFPVTHVICPECCAKMMGDMLGEKVS